MDEDEEARLQAFAEYLELSREIGAHEDDAPREEWMAGLKWARAALQAQKDGQYLCEHCGRLAGNYGGGWAAVGEARVCHPNVAGRPDCYRLITVYGEPVGARRLGSGAADTGTAGP
jgi:hypothetical protein